MNALRRRAIALLARREHTRQELLQKLAKLASPAEINPVLDELTAGGQLSDARYLDAYVRSHAARFGRARLRQSLRQKGVADELIAARLAALNDEGEGAADGEAGSEITRARAVWAKKFSTVPADAKEWARQARFLQGRGFGVDVIRKAIQGAQAPTEAPT